MTRVEGWRLRGWGEGPRWEPIDVPDPGTGEVVVAVDACGVGLTVLNCMNGHLDDSPNLLPLTPGHEVVGRVVEVGDGVEYPRVGDRVVTYFYLACFRCRNCLSGNESRCTRLAGWFGVHRDGGYAPVSVLPSGNAIAMRYDIPAAEATVIPDAVATSVHVCLRRLHLRPGDRVVVIGAGGGVGTHMVQVAASCGATVAGLDRTEDKLSLIEELGAVPIYSEDIATVDLKELDGGADAVIDLVGTPETLGWGMSKLVLGGRLCVLTTFRNVSLPVEPRELVFKECSILGSRYASRSDLSEAADLVAAGSVRPIVGGVVEAPEVEGLHEALRAGTLRGRGAIVWGSQ